MLRGGLFPDLGYPADLVSNERQRSTADSRYRQQLLVRQRGNYTHPLDAALSQHADNPLWQTAPDYQIGWSRRRFFLPMKPSLRHIRLVFVAETKN
jgi:hypothetical protein